MKVFYKVGGSELSFSSVEDFTLTINSGVFANKEGLLTVYTESLKDRLFVSYDSEFIYISDNLREIASRKNSLTINESALNFYKEFGFLLPPATQYSDIFFVTPFRRFFISNESISFTNVYPEFSNAVDLKTAIDSFFSKVRAQNFDILVSGGIDSSALLGYLHEKSLISKAYMCKMSSLGAEEERAERLCRSIGVDFNLIDLDKDLTEVAKVFLEESGELISDSISIVMLELFRNVSNGNNGKPIYIVDGQGADSLLNGLPLSKVYQIWRKLGKVRPLISLFSNIPIYKNKSSSFKRKLYRLSKALKCLSQTEFHKSIIIALSEVDTNHSDLGVLTNRLVELNNQYKDWHFVLRYFYLFDLLPAREMQKYLFANRFNITVLAPFLDESLIKSIISTENSKTIFNGDFKFPITKMAKDYWPGEFMNSATSPFQVNYSLGNDDAKGLSISMFYKAK